MYTLITLFLVFFLLLNILALITALRSTAHAQRNLHMAEDSLERSRSLGLQKDNTLRRQQEEINRLHDLSLELEAQAEQQRQLVQTWREQHERLLQAYHALQARNDHVEAFMRDQKAEPVSSDGPQEQVNPGPGSGAI